MQNRKNYTMVRERAHFWERLKVEYVSCDGLNYLERWFMRCTICLLYGSEGWKNHVGQGKPCPLKFHNLLWEDSQQQAHYWEKYLINAVGDH